MQSCVLFSNSPKNLRYLEKRSSMRPNPYLIAIIIILFGLYCLVMYIRRWSTLKEQSIQQKSWFIASFVANKPFKAIYYRKFWPSDFLHPSSLDLNPHGSNSYRQMKSVACREYNQNMELLWVHIHVAWTTDILGKICMAAAGFHHLLDNVVITLEDHTKYIFCSEYSIFSLLLLAFGCKCICWKVTTLRSYFFEKCLTRLFTPCMFP